VWVKVPRAALGLTMLVACAGRSRSDHAAEDTEHAGSGNQTTASGAGAAGTIPRAGASGTGGAGSVEPDPATAGGVGSGGRGSGGDGSQACNAYLAADLLSACNTLGRCEPTLPEYLARLSALGELDGYVARQGCGLIELVPPQSSPALLLTFDAAGELAGYFAMFPSNPRCRASKKIVTALSRASWAPSVSMTRPERCSACGAPIRGAAPASPSG
jgi:hypothetical protein